MSGPSQEQRILVAMRKVLAQIVKDTTPTATGMRHPLRDQTIQMIRECFMIISEREKILHGEQGKTSEERPYYKDDPNKPSVVSIKSIKKSDCE